MLLKKEYFLLIFVLLLSSCVSNPGRNFSSRPISQSSVRGTIVLDAGHGGEDPGSKGRRGLTEKDVTLDIVKRVYRLVKRVMPNVKIILTRTKDRYVGLEERVNIANRSQADLFLSVHINASENRAANGFEVYSLDIASDRHSERLAARENKSFARDKGGVNFILADLRANSNRAKSDQLADHISKGLSHQLAKVLSQTSIKDRGYNQAIFHVLFVKMPAVLTELFFISNDKDERRLKNPQFRELCARGLVLGIKKFLEQNTSRESHG